MVLAAGLQEQVCSRLRSLRGAGAILMTHVRLLARFARVGRVIFCGCWVALAQARAWWGAALVGGGRVGCRWCYRGRCPIRGPRKGRRWGGLAWLSWVDPFAFN